MTAAVLTAAEAARFWAKVDKSGDCWIWTHSTDRRGYGNVRIRRKLYRSHRIAYELLAGPIPPGLLLRHDCDNPLCVRPDHLTPGTDWDNIHDCIARGRKVQVRGERVSTAKLTAAQVTEIRLLAGQMSMRAIGRAYGITHQNVRAILTGQSWTHIAGAA